MTLISRFGRHVALLGILFACAGCASDPAEGDARLLETTLSAYHTALRWGSVEQALAFRDPKLEKTKPVSAFELERWRQFRVVGYRASPPGATAPGLVQQRVALELLNINTQGVRSVTDLQEWRYDPTAERWWLTSGLPSLDSR